MGIFVEFETVVITINRRLEVVQNRINPMKAAHVDAFSLGADDFTLMSATQPSQRLESRPGCLKRLLRTLLKTAEPMFLLQRY